jgi:hypothetical protein
LISLVANFLILPAQPPIMIGGMVTLIVGLAWEMLGRVAALVPWLFLTYTVTVVNILAAVPRASVETGALGRTLVGLYGIILAAILIWRSWPTARVFLPAFRRTLAWLVAAVIPASLLASAVTLLPDERLHLTFIPGEGSEAVLVTTPGGRSVWIWDGQGDGAALAAEVPPALLNGPARVSIIFGPDMDGVWPGAHVLAPGETPPGTVVRLGRAVQLERLAAFDGWRLRYGEFSTLLPATLRGEAQIEPRAAPAANLGVTLLKTPNAGTGAWPTLALLEATTPQVILWPLGTTYPPDVVEWLSGRHAARVPEDSIVEVVSDGKHIWLQHRSKTGPR